MAKNHLMHLGLFLHGTGSHIAGWRPEGATDSNQALSHLQAITKEAEASKFDLVFVGDSLWMDPFIHPSYAARLEPLTLLSALSMATTHIGLVATATTTYNQPYNVARAFASLDHISNGRAGWNAVTSADAQSGENFGVPHPDHARRYKIAEEFVSVVKGLWDCWQDDAIVADRATGLFIDPKKVRPLNFEGEFFKVKGPLNIGRSPQGHPIVVQAGGSPDGKKLAARIADIAFSVVQDFDEARKEYAELKKLAIEAGRSADHIAILPGVMPVIGDTDRDAFEKLAWLQSFVDDKNGLAMLTNRLGIDFTGYDLDGPIPEIPATDGSQAFARALLAKAKRENMTLRDLYNLNSASRGHWVLCGSAENVANTLCNWFTEGAADGFNIMPAYFPDEFTDFTQKVVPILQDRGVFRRDYTATTLRGHLGLPRPVNSEAGPVALAS